MDRAPKEESTGLLLVSSSVLRSSAVSGLLSFLFSILGKV